MANSQKPTKRVDLAEMMRPMAEALDEWALIREKVLDKIDLQAASDARALSGEIKFCLGQIELTDSMADGEAATKRLQQLRSNALELLARHK